MIVTPLMICMMLKYMQGIGAQLNQRSLLEYPIHEVDQMAKCINGPDHKKGDPDCITVGYSIIGDPKKNKTGQYAYIHDLMQTVSEKSGLEYGKDLKQLTIGKSSDLTNYLNTHANKTYYAVLFCAEDWNEKVEFETLDSEKLYNFSLTEQEKKKTLTFDFYMPCKFEKHPDKEMIFYSLFYNISLLPNTFFAPAE